MQQALDTQLDTPLPTGADTMQARTDWVLLDALDHAVAVTDGQLRIVWVNRAFTEVTGFAFADALGRQPVETVIADAQDAAFYDDIWACVRRGSVWRGDLINRRCDGHLYNEEVVISPVRVAGVQGINSFMVVKQDVSSRKLLEAQLRQLSITDPLTGVENRRSFMMQLERLHARYCRHGHAVSLLMLDLDFFKQINDRYGHAVGDDVLRHFSQLMVERLRRTDYFARLGGEEFAALLPDTALSGAQAIADVLRQCVAALPVPTSMGLVSVTVSVGVAQLGPDDLEPSQLLVRADAALYQAKALGRNRVVLAEPALRQRLSGLLG
ncbi:MAG: hypothetical protein RLZZ352_2196 [Pseudomonadota bacterium]